jgi:hypothetical protein
MNQPRSTHNDAAAIRTLNDRLRQQHQGGRLFLSAGISALEPIAIAAILHAIAEFDAFTGDNDPYGEHDCASLNWSGQSILWKIDYYDPTLQYHSDDATDPAITVRVMTVMFSSEY